MPVTIYYDDDADLSLLKGKTIAILGYGSQGHAQAQNLRDSGCDVVIGQRKGSPNYDLAVKHGFKPMPADEATKAGDLVNIDVSAEKDGYFADTGASFAVPPVARAVERLCRDGRRAMWTGLRQVGTGMPFAGIGRAVGTFARQNGYTLVRNLASHGVGLSLHEAPTEIATWPDASERRVMTDGLVFTVEPFLSLGANWAENGDDDWTLYSEPRAPTVQFEHTVVATKNGPLILTLPG